MCHKKPSQSKYIDFIAMTCLLLARNIGTHVISGERRSTEVIYITAQTRRKTRFQNEPKSRGWLLSHLPLSYDLCSLSIRSSGQFSLCLSSYWNFLIISNSPVTWHLLHNTQNFPWLYSLRILSFFYLCLWKSRYFLKLCANQDFFFSFFLLFLPCRAACVILIPWWGMEPGAWAVSTSSPNHRITREVSNQDSFDLPGRIVYMFHNLTSYLLCTPRLLPSFLSYRQCYNDICTLYIVPSTIFRGYWLLSYCVFILSHHQYLAFHLEIWSVSLVAWMRLS